MIIKNVSTESTSHSKPLQYVLPERARLHSHTHITMKKCYPQTVTHWKKYKNQRRYRMRKGQQRAKPC